MNQDDIHQQIELLSQQVQQRANQLASQDPYISRLTGQIEVYRSFLESSSDDSRGEYTATMDGNQDA